MKMWSTDKNGSPTGAIGWGLALHGVGFALYWCGCFLLWENWFYGGDIAHWASRIGEVAALGVLGAVCLRRSVDERLLAVGGAMLQLGAFGLQCIEGGDVAVSVCGLCSGGAAALFLCAALSVFFRMRPRISQTAIVAALVGAHAVAIVALVLLPGELSQVDSLLILVGSLVLMATCLSCPSRDRGTVEALRDGLSDDDSIDKEEGCPVPVGRGLRCFGPCWTLMAPLVVPSIVFAVLCGAATQAFVEGAVSSGVSYLVADAAAMGALAILLCIAWRGIEISIETSTLVVLPVFALIMLTASLFSPAGIIDISVCIRASFTVVQALIWVYFAREGFERMPGALAAFAWSLALLRGSVLVGRLAAGLVCAHFGADVLGSMLSVLLGIWLLYVTAMLMLGMLALRRAAAAGAAVAPDAPVVPTSPYELAARQFGLSPREQRIMELFASGRSAPHIGGELFLSESTVRTYIRRIYQKMGTHSRQELIDAVESMREDSEVSCSGHERGFDKPLAS